MISHRNVIANTLQVNIFEKPPREVLKAKDPSYPDHEISLGLLPQSHIYALVYICHVGPYRGDQIIVLPKFEINSYLNAIQRFKITALALVRLPLQMRRHSRWVGWLTLKNQVPPIIITMLRNQDLLKKFNLSSVRSVFTGAAPLGAETAQELQNLFPSWAIRQGYGKSYHTTTSTYFPGNKSTTLTPLRVDRDRHGRSRKLTTRYLVWLKRKSPAWCRSQDSYSRRKRNP